MNSHCLLLCSSNLQSGVRLQLIRGLESKPQDKSRVEASVKFFYQRVKAPLRNRVFHSEHELNAAIAEHMTTSNNTPMQRTGVSRREHFEKMERAHLSPLPTEKFALKWRKRLMVQTNYHIWLSTDRTYYSVPHTHVGSRVDVIYTATLVSIYAQGKLVATHRRTHVPGSYCTKKEHMTPPHREMLNRHVEHYLHWAEATTSQEIYAVVARILHARRFVQQSYKSCDGVKALHRKYGKDALQRACSVALEVDRCTYGFLREYLQTHPDTDTIAEHLPSVPKHDNIRGPAYYH